MIVIQPECIAMQCIGYFVSIVSQLSEIVHLENANGEGLTAQSTTVEGHTLSEHAKYGEELHSGL